MLYVKSLGDGVNYLDSDEASVPISFGGTSGDSIFTLTIDTSDFNGSSYAANNGSHTKTDSGNNSIEYWTNQIMLQSSVMQWQKSNAYLYNVTDLGELISLSINVSVGGVTVYEGTSKNPTSKSVSGLSGTCLLYTSDAADE